MVKQCKLIHINDGSARTLENGNYHFVEEYHWAAQYLERYLDEGYEVKQMVPEFSPNVSRPGCYPFFKSGFTFYLEREVDEEVRTEDEAKEIVPNIICGDDDEEEEDEEEEDEYEGFVIDPDEEEVYLDLEDLFSDD